jgi:outer membrane protein assembly factor BamB
MTFKKLLATAFLLITLLAAQTGLAQKADANTKAAIAGKTYQAWSAGKFDDHMNAAGAAKLVFDRNGKGACRQFFAYKPDMTAAEQHELNVEYMEVNGKPALAFSHKNGVDAGKVYITSYDNGARVWVEGIEAARPMKGWMLQIPPAPAK